MHNEIIKKKLLIPNSSSKFKIYPRAAYFCDTASRRHQFAL